MRVTYLVMKQWDRLTIKQGQAVLKALETVDPNEILWDQEKPNYQLAIEKLERAIETAKEKEAAREAKKAEEQAKTLLQSAETEDPSIAWLRRKL